MGESASVFKTILQLIEMAISITTIVYVAKIYKGTKENPLEVFDRNIESIASNTIDNVVPSKVSKVKDKFCQCGEKIINKICSEEQIIEGCYDISKYEENLSLRVLEDSTCDEIQTELTNNNDKLSEVFDLNYGTVRKMALGILIVLCLVGFSVFITLMTQVGIIICGEKAALIILPFFICIICICLFAGLTNFILFMIMLVKYYKGRTTGEFLDFYEDCLDADEKSSLEKTYNKLDDINKDMTVFVALNFVQLGLSMIESCLSFFTREKK